MSKPFQVDAEELDGGIHEIQVAGELDFATLPQLEGPLAAALESSAGGILVNLSDCAFIDSTGLGLLMNTRERVNGDGRQFTICCFHDQVRKLFEMTGMDRVVELHESRESALESLRN